MKAMLLVTMFGGMATAAEVMETRPEKVRPMTTDRPDQTEGAYTVPKGWFQIESGLFSHSSRLNTEERTEINNYAEVNLKYGIAQDVDLQAIWVPHVRHRHKDAGGQVIDEAEGHGDVFFRAKWNVVGNDEGAYALSLMPWVKAPVAEPTLGNDMWEFGLGINQAFDLGGGFSVGSSLFLNQAVNLDNDHYFEPTISAVLGWAATDRVGLYVEVFSAWRMDEERYLQTSLDGGITFLMTENLQFDAGVNWFFRGECAVNPFVGVSWRF